MRLYWWFRGAPADRPGGPWWVETFITMPHLPFTLTPHQRRDRMLDTLRPFLHAYALTDGSEQLASDSSPPPNAQVVICEELAP